LKIEDGLEVSKARDEWRKNGGREGSLRENGDKDSSSQERRGKNKNN